MQPGMFADVPNVGVGVRILCNMRLGGHQARSAISRPRPSRSPCAFSLSSTAFWFSASTTFLGQARLFSGCHKGLRVAWPGRGSQTPGRFAWPWLGSTCCASRLCWIEFCRLAIKFCPRSLCAKVFQKRSL